MTDPNGLLSPAQLADEEGRSLTHKCGGCGFWFDLSREGTDYQDDLSPERVTLCGVCLRECEDDALKALDALAFGTDAFIDALKGRKP